MRTSHVIEWKDHEVRYAGAMHSCCRAAAGKRRKKAGNPTACTKLGRDVAGQAEFKDPLRTMVTSSSLVYVTAKCNVAFEPYFFGAGEKKSEDLGPDMCMLGHLW